MELKDLSEAEKCLQYAMEHYRKYDVYWRRSVANAYLGLISASRGEKEQAMHYIHQAESYANLIKNPYEINVVGRITREITSTLENQIP